MPDLVLVVTPTRNAESYLEQTIRSVVEQRGDFELHYHIQDAGSTDRTLTIVRTWIDRLGASGGRFHGGPPVLMTCTSSPDASMYDGIQKGFDALFRTLVEVGDRRVLMTWINGDDILAAGAIQTAVSFHAAHPDRHWLTGIPSVLLPDGAIGDVRDAPFVYGQRELARGAHDGRSRLFLQQEGTFFTTMLWSSVGGLNQNLRLAGDWDLWRRMARHSPVITLRAVLALHRRHDGQQSSALDAYWREVDTLKAGDDTAVDDAIDEVGLAAKWTDGRWTVYPVALSDDEQSGRTNADIAHRRTAAPVTTFLVTPPVPAEHFCTYFDHRYAAKGLAMWRSLKRACPTASLHVLCLNDRCLAVMRGLELPDVHLHALSDLEAADPDLVQARDNRSLIEYYFTLTPCLPLHVFRLRPDIARLTYLDADLFFFASPQPIFDEIADSAIGVIEHRFSDNLKDHERFGRFNVGWLTFRHDPVALDCLEHWRAQCLEWCCDRLEPERFAEQKYLDAWPDRVERLCIVQHRGANVAPWNLNRFPLAVDGERLTAGGEPMIFFHAHGFQPDGPGRARSFNLQGYGVEETPLLREQVFAPYEKALLDEVNQIATPLALSLLTDRPRTEELRVEVLQERLAASERQRETGIAANRRLEQRLNTLAAEGSRKDAAIAHLRGSEEAHRRRVAAFERSLSWRLTSPVRWLADLFGFRGRG